MKSQTLELYVFRHGQTDWNVEGRIQGHLDIPLNDTGRVQARNLIRHFERLKVEHFLASDLSRAWESAEIVAHALRHPVARHPGLREIFLGDLQGLTREEIHAKHGQEMSDHLRHSPLSDEDVAKLGSESSLQVLNRALIALVSFASQNPSAHRVGVCSHGGVIRRLVQTGYPEGGFPQPIKNGVIYPFEMKILDDRLESLNLIGKMHL